MNFREFKNSPLGFKLLMIACVLLACYLTFILFHSLRLSHTGIRGVMQLLLWVSICIGFYLTKKWAWATFFVIMLFSLLSIIYSLLSLRMPINVFAFVSIAIVALIIWGLNLKTVRTLFHIDERKGNNVAMAVTNFTIFSFAVGLFVFFELLGTSRVAAGSVPMRLFLACLGFVYILLGMGIWQVNKYAVQAALPLLLFTAISVAIILVYDFIEVHRFLAVRKSVYYILMSVGMLLYWVKVVHPKISNVN